MSTPSSSTTPFWEQAWKDAQPALSSIRTSLASFPAISPRILRVGQLDAELLDQELLGVLKEPVNKALGQIKSAYETRFDPEVALVIATVLYKFSMWDQGATYGAKLQDLKYHAPRVPPPTNLAPSGLPRRSLLLHAALTVLVPYLHNRIRTHALDRAWPDAPSNNRKRKAWDLLARLEAVHSTLSLFSFIAFLYDGRYRTIVDRILRLRLVPARPIVTRNVSYEFMNRQMVWHSFTEFLIFLLPLVNTRTIRRKIAQVYSNARPNALLSLLSFATPSPTSPPEKGKGNGSVSPLPARRGKYWTLPPDQCAICASNASYNISNITGGGGAAISPPYRTTGVQNEQTHELGEDEDEDEDAMPSYPITTPYITSCGHVYCYFCLSEKMIRAAKDSADGGGGGGGGGDEGSMWECLRCGEGVRSCERLVGVDTSESGSVSDLEVDARSDRMSDIGDIDAEYSED